MVRTIEQILGAQPLNEKVAATTPMYGAFTAKAVNKPFTAMPTPASGSGIDKAKLDRNCGPAPPATGAAPTEQP